MRVAHQFPPHCRHPKFGKIGELGDTEDADTAGQSVWPFDESHPQWEGSVLPGYLKNLKHRLIRRDRKNKNKNYVLCSQIIVIQSLKILYILGGSMWHRGWRKGSAYTLIFIAASRQPILHPSPISFLPRSPKVQNGLHIPISFFFFKPLDCQRIPIYFLFQTKASTGLFLLKLAPQCF